MIKRDFAIMKVVVVVLMVSVFSLALLGCGGSSSSPTEPSASIVGTWRNTDDSGETLTFNADGTFILTEGDNTSASGTYTTQGSNIEFRITSSSISDMPAGTTMTGTYSISGNTLTLNTGETMTFTRV